MTQRLTRWPRCPICERVPDGDQRLTRGEVMTEAWLKAHLKSCTARSALDVKVTKKQRTKAPKVPREPRKNIIDDLKDLLTKRTTSAVKEILNEGLDSGSGRRRR